MDKSSKLLFISGAITILGFLTCIVGYLLGGRVTGIGLSSTGIGVYTADDWGNGESANYNEETIRLDAFNSINLDAAYADIRIEESDHYGLAYKTRKRDKPAYGIDNGTLNILLADDSPYSFQLMFFGMNPAAFHSETKNEYIIIYIPAGSVLNDVTLHLGSGDTGLSDVDAASITVDNDYGAIDMNTVTASSIDLRLENGDLSISDISTGNLQIHDAYGNCRMQRITVSGETSLKMESGSLDITDSSLGSVRVWNSYGDIACNGVSAINAAFSLKSGNCRMRDFLFDTLSVDSSYGNVDLRTALPDSGYSFDLSTSYGEVHVDNVDVGTKYVLGGSQNKSVFMTCESGDINVWTEK